MSDIIALRKLLFDTIEGLQKKTISIEQAKSITDVSQVIVNSAKVEVDYAKATGQKLSSGFLPEPSIPGITTHRIR